METYRHGGYSSVAERQTVALDVVGSTPTTHPNIFFTSSHLRFRMSNKKRALALLDRPLPQRHLDDLAVCLAHGLVHHVAILIERRANVRMTH